MPKEACRLAGWRSSDLADCSEHWGRLQAWLLTSVIEEPECSEDVPR